ncbi:flagellar motor protein MotB [Jeongeupia naejangsanensis]|uniref:OmpA family protein n=1 Tax=Jeongeupia naejangsanensis TaxID=613195 RepID=A0ABS2BIS0_9NEIS|nr:flagellar motor protein MotB [Jeongeupia naejangsanensis]MBM3114709.1 OmpA family protein [Jeongeupia naejangsanensis]
MSLDKDKHDAAIVKRAAKKHHDDGHGGAWKVAFADFCLALMCLFLVLWVLAARNQEQAEELLRTPGGNIANEGGDKLLQHMSTSGSMIPREPRPGRDQSEGTTPGRGDGAEGTQADGIHLSKSRLESAEDLQELANALSQLSDDANLSRNLQTVITPYGLRVLLHDTDKQGMFQSGSAMPTDPFRKLLHRMGPLFAQIDNQMLVVGHTDAHPYAGKSLSAYSNWSLSSNRAMVARVNLLEGGMPAKSILQVVGMADRAPLDVQDPLAAQNRRIELLILTSDQARLIGQMFAMPEASVPLVNGASTSLPDQSLLSTLRKKLSPPAQ